MKKILISILLCCSTSAIAASSSFIIKFDKNRINLPTQKNVDCTDLSKLNKVKTLTFNYNGSNGYEGSPQSYDLQGIYYCVKAYVKGGGGSSWHQSVTGGAGDYVWGVFNTKGMDQINIIVAGHTDGNSASGGGLSGVFSNTPSKNTALIVAGGGGSRVYVGGQSNVGYNASFNPQQPSVKGYAGGYGYGGTGTLGPGNASNNNLQVATSFGKGANYGTGAYGGYGGGGVDGGHGAGGGSGMPGGYGGNCSESDCASGAGSSYCDSSVLNCNDSPGNGGQGGQPNSTITAAEGKSGSVTLEFYR